MGERLPCLMEGQTPLTRRLDLVEGDAAGDGLVGGDGQGQRLEGLGDDEGGFGPLRR